MDIKNTGQGKIFNNPFLEKLTRAHASVPITMHYLIAVTLMVYSFYGINLNLSQIIIYFFAGLLFWTIFEYLAHRYIFHMATTTKIREKIQYTFHGVHHEYPRDKNRIVMPPLPGFIIGVALIVVFRLAAGEPGYAFAAGFLAGYASYALVHYSIHTRIPPKNIIGKLWMHHSYHHYKNDAQAYGVSSPLWDYVFRTMPKSYR
jgi:sterol desaturase/sphingolipid hydroxylase (fatty acid hydroxylase superfamily)